MVMNHINTFLFIYYVVLSKCNIIIIIMKLETINYYYVVWGVLVACWLKCWPAIERLQVQAPLGTGFFRL